MGEQWHFDPGTYLQMVRAEIPDYDGLQALVADASATVKARRILDLGSGTGVTARTVLDRHPGAELVGVDASNAMLAHARRLVPEATFVVGQLEDELPAGPFDLVVSVFAIHHLDADAKADLFGRIAALLRPGGRFVLCDVVVPHGPVDRPVPLNPDHDRPSPLADQLDWLHETGMETSIVSDRGDHVVLAAARPAG